MARPRGMHQKTRDFIQLAYEVASIAHPITVRGIAYKLFAAQLLPDMGTNSTAKVSRIVTAAREQNIIPWSWVVDETRRPERISTWSSPDEIIAGAVNQYRRDYWQAQSHWIEVWSEKGTVRGVLAPLLDEFGLTFRVHHGFSGAGTVHDVADETQRADRRLTVLYVGDYDPSGMHMSEVDLPGRIAGYGGSCTVKRIALHRADGDGLPSFPASDKKRDPRYRWFVDRYGHQCWELDAMDPNALRERIRAEVERYIDRDLWQHCLDVEAAEVESMRHFHAAWRQSCAAGSPGFLRPVQKNPGEIDQEARP